jgi:hypothetical protein
MIKRIIMYDRYSGITVFLPLLIGACYLSGLSIIETLYYLLAVLGYAVLVIVSMKTGLKLSRGISLRHYRARHGMDPNREIKQSFRRVRLMTMLVVGAFCMAISITLTILWSY